MYHIHNPSFMGVSGQSDLRCLRAPWLFLPFSTMLLDARKPAAAAMFRFLKDGRKYGRVAGTWKQQ